MDPTSTHAATVAAEPTRAMATLAPVAATPVRKRKAKTQQTEEAGLEEGGGAAGVDSSMAAAPSAASRPTRRRSHRAVEYEPEEAKVPADAEMADEPPPLEAGVERAESMPAAAASSAAAAAARPVRAKSAAVKVQTPTKGKSAPPEHWKTVYMGIEHMRLHGQAAGAPVDTAGCERLAQSVEPHVFRFQTLVALMLSAQTKDAVTAAAMKALDQYFAADGGLTVDNILRTDESQIDQLICKVGFHTRKANFIKRTAAVCKEKYGGDIPATLEELIALPGVGPKMAHLTMQCGWKSVVGIGVDTHVHRISNRLGWVKSNTPEQTRMQLEEWLPRDYWGAVNVMLVGFGQMICQPIGPKCRQCDVNSLCPEGRRNLRYDKDPNKFRELPPMPSIEQLRAEDEAIAEQALGAKAAAPVPDGPVVTSRFFARQQAMKDEPFAEGAAAAGVKIEPPAAAAATSSSPLVKQEPVEKPLAGRTPKRLKLEK